MRNNNIRIYLYIISLFLFFQNCQITKHFQKDHNNYFNSSFECFNNEGWREEAKFDKFIGYWALISAKYQLDNKALGSAKIVITGNSLVHLFTPELIEREFPAKGVINRGIGGDMTETLILRIEKDVISLSPSTIIIEIGGNDLIQGKCLSRIQNNVHSIIETIRKKLPKTRIIFLSVPPTDVPNLNAIVPVYNSFLSTLPSRYKNLIYIETWQDMRDPDKPTIKDELIRKEIGDKIHFNENGYSIWGKLIRPHL
ncbi:MAG: GDSL-type esterase/lipase family protein [Leptospiraceae bacterium]|nr:GDSL-type esterase/lipase family protein [Leptospiraceae bacterium]